MSTSKELPLLIRQVDLFLDNDFLQSGACRFEMGTGKLKWLKNWQNLMRDLAEGREGEWRTSDDL